MVGAAGLEPAISCSQSTCVTRLRYSPTISCTDTARAPDFGRSGLSLQRSYRICCDAVLPSERGSDAARHHRRTGHDTATDELDEPARLLAPPPRGAADEPGDHLDVLDAVGQLARFLCRARHANVARRRSPASTSRRSSPTCSSAGSRPPPTTAIGRSVVLPLARRRGRDPREPDGPDEPPRLPETPPPVLREAELSGSSRPAQPTRRSPVGATRRSSLFIDTGSRRAELLGLTLDDVDLDAQAELRAAARAGATRLRGHRFERRFRRSTATSARAPSIPRGASDRVARQEGPTPRAASPSSSATAAARPASPAVSTPTCSATRCPPRARGRDAGGRPHGLAGWRTREWYALCRLDASGASPQRRHGRNPTWSIDSDERQ